MENNNLDKLYEICLLLRYDCFRNEIEDYLKGYRLLGNDNKNVLELIFKNEFDEKIRISYKSNHLCIYKYGKNFVERIVIYENLVMEQRNVEKRQNGIIITDIHKKYGPSYRFGNEIVLVDLYEKRYVFTKENIEKNFANIEFETVSPMNLLLKIKQEERKNDFRKYCDFSSEFSTHLNYYFQWADGRRKLDNIYPTYTYLNGEDVSRLYDLIDDDNKLYRVYDLYRGIINPRNEDDIFSIRLGLLSAECFGLRSLRGITNREVALVGDSMESVSLKYIDYLKYFLYDYFGYNNEIKLDRLFILNIINHQMTMLEISKEYVESILGIPYSEYEKKDINSQLKLIKEKTGIKVKFDYSMFVNRFTFEEDDKELSIISKKIYKRILRKILGNNN